MPSPSNAPFVAFRPADHLATFNSAAAVCVPGRAMITFPSGVFDGGAGRANPASTCSVECDWVRIISRLYPAPSTSLSVVLML